VSTARPLAWFNGRLVPRELAAPSVASNNLHLGTSVFDGLMAYWNGDRHHLHEVEAHIARFCAGTRSMHLPIGFTGQELIAGITALVGALPGEDHYIRPIALRTAPELYDVRRLDAPADVAILAVSAERDVDPPMTTTISPWRRVSSSAIPVAWKVSGAYANSMIAQYDAYARGVDTAILLDGRGRISEACTANIFFVAGTTLVTPTLDADVFPGITRSLVWSLAERRGLTVVARDVLPDELPSFDGAFICATLLELRALQCIDELAYPGADLDVFQALLADFRGLTHQRVATGRSDP
jgi:branched-chain amino acid aminotransferase